MLADLILHFLHHLFNQIFYHRNDFPLRIFLVITEKHQKQMFHCFHHHHPNEKTDSPIFFSTVCVVFFYDLFTILMLFVVIMLAYVKYLLKFVVKLFLFHVFSFRFVFGDYSTTENVVDTSSAGPNNARKFPFITDVLR